MFTDDPCFLDDEELLKEYILNPDGKIYYGSSTWGPRPREWDFAQVSHVVYCNSEVQVDEIRDICKNILILFHANITIP